MTTPPLTHTVEGLMALVKSFGDIEILHAIGKVSSFERKKALDDIQSYAVWLVDATAVDAAAEALKGKPAAQASAEPTDENFGVSDMTMSWLADADKRVESLSQHLRAVLEVAHTWQPDYATVMDRKTLRLAAETCDYEAARAALVATPVAQP